MGSIKNLKKDINYVIGDLLDAIYLIENQEGFTSHDKSEALIDEALAIFDELMEKVNAKNVESKKAHFKAVSADLETKARAIVEKINSLS